MISSRWIPHISGDQEKHNETIQRNTLKHKMFLNPSHYKYFCVQTASKPDCKKTPIWVLRTELGFGNFATKDIITQ